MANRRCPKCGEEYSNTYRACPFCEEEDAIKHGRPLRRRGGRRVEKRPGKTGGAGGVMLLLTAVIIVGVMGYVFFGEDLAEAVGIRTTPDPVFVGSDEPEKIPPIDNTAAPPPAVVPSPTVPDEPTSGESSPPDIAADPAAPEPAGPLSLSQTDITIPAGETGRITATGGSGAISWSSSNPEIASVDGGAVTGKAGGTVTITASSGEESATCQVKVEGDPWVNPNPDSFKLSKTDFTLKPSESTWQMKIKRNDGSWEILGSADGVVWASNNPSVCTISDTGVVTRTGKGTTQITATVDGVTLDCTVRMS